VPKHQIPYSIQESTNSTNPRISPISSLIERPEEHEVHAKCVGADTFVVFVRVYDISLRLTHFCAVFAQESVRSKMSKRFLKAEGVPGHARAIVMNLLYMRWRTECSGPPIYMSTGSHLAVRVGSNGRSSSAVPAKIAIPVKFPPGDRRQLPFDARRSHRVRPPGPNLLFPRSGRAGCSVT
jgi:hypothetical protein